MKKLILKENKFYLKDSNGINEISKLLNEEIEIPYFYNIHSHLGENIYKDIEGEDWTITKYLEHTFEVISQLGDEEFKNKTLESFNDVVLESKNNLIKGICASRSAIVCSEHRLNNLAGYPIMKVEGRKEYLNEGIKGFERYYKENNSENCSVGLSIHSLYTNTEKELLFAKECFDKYNCFLTIHISEDSETRQKEIEMYGSKPLATLERFGLLSNKTIIVHCGHLDEEDLNLVKKYDVTIAICPISNVFLNTKIIDVNKLNELGIKWCIATDGLATGRTFSMEKQALYLKDLFNDISYKDLYNRISFEPRSFFKELDSYNETIKINISCENEEEFFEKILKKDYKR